MGTWREPVSDQHRADRDEHVRSTRDAYDRLAPVWSKTTDEGPFNGFLERPALRSLVPRPLTGMTILDAGCGSGAQCEWLLGEGADVVGVDLSPGMVEQADRRCQGRGRFLVADLSEPLPLEPSSIHGITCSLALLYLGPDRAGNLLEIVSVFREDGTEIVIHAMRMRRTYEPLLRETGNAND